jgi:phosphoglycerate dehydrogenase-like enzyme
MTGRRVGVSREVGSVSFRVVLVGGSGDDIAAGLIDRVPGAEIVRVADPGRLADALRDADAVVCNRLTPGDTRNARRLRLVQAMSAGADRVDPAALPRGCVLCNAYEHEDAIAEWVLMAVLALTHHLLLYDRGLRAGSWSRDLPLERELRDRTLGTIGYGHIGRRVVELGRAFGMDAVAVTRSPTPERGHGLRWLRPLQELNGLFEAADVAVVCVPLTPETEGLVGHAQLDLLGPEGYLANVARGGVVQERPLYEALRDRRIAGAALDVWWRYPESRDASAQPSEYPFHELDNVVMTPHVSGRSEGTRRGRAVFVVDQLVRLAQGDPLENVVAEA